jgi:hypothetical protein
MIKLNNIKVKHVIIIVIGCIYFLFLLLIFLAVPISFISDNLKVDTTKENIVTPITIIPETPKPTIDEIVAAEKAEIIKYNEWSIPITNELSLLFEKIALDCGEYNLPAVKQDFELLAQIRAKFEKKEYPEAFNNYQNDIINMFIEWDNVYIALLENDAAGVQFYANKANGYMDKAIEEYIKVLTEYKI